MEAKNRGNDVRDAGAHNSLQFAKDDQDNDRVFAYWCNNLLSYLE